MENKSVNELRKLYLSDWVPYRVFFSFSYFKIIVNRKGEVFLSVQVTIIALSYTLAKDKFYNLNKMHVTCIKHI